MPLGQRGQCSCDQNKSRTNQSHPYVSPTVGGTSGTHSGLGFEVYRPSSLWQSAPKAVINKFTPSNDLIRVSSETHIKFIKKVGSDGSDDKIDK